MKKYFTTALILCSTTVAYAQTAVHKQATDTSDVCAGVNPATADDMYSCAMEAWPGNVPVALKWWRLAADHGSWLSQLQLGNMYEAGDGVPKDAVQAYKWFDIAAATHGAEIDKLPSVADSAGADDNQTEINYRDGVAKTMTQTQVVQAQKLSREWQASHKSFAGSDPKH